MNKIMANSITNLMLKGVGIGTHGALVLCDLLSRENGSLNSLKALYLSSNFIYTYGAKAFGKVFAINTSLTFIDLRDNLIEAAAIDVMAEGMASNPEILSLETLDLQDNVIGGYMVSKTIPELSKLAQVFHGHASKRINKSYEDYDASAGVGTLGGGIGTSPGANNSNYPTTKESNLFVGGNQVVFGLASKLRDDYEGSALKVFV